MHGVVRQRLERAAGVKAQIVVVVLEQVLAKEERTLVSSGHEDAVMALRHELLVADRGVDVGEHRDRGTDDGQFFGPIGVAADGGAVYVSELNNRIQKFDSQGNQSVDDQRIQDGTLRLTWQAARQHKIRDSPCVNISRSITIRLQCTCLEDRQFASSTTHINKKA